MCIFYWLFKSIKLFFYIVKFYINCSLPLPSLHPHSIHKITILHPFESFDNVLVLFVNINTSPAHILVLPSHVLGYIFLPRFNSVLIYSFQATNMKTGLHYCLYRIHGYRLNNVKVTQLVDLWKKLQHSSVTQLREVFTSKVFGDNCKFVTLIELMPLLFYKH